jgi:hypothetical protein
MSKENNLEVEDNLSKENKSSEELKEKFNENNENDNSDNIILKEKIDELKYFDAVSHFKENIIHFSKNCSEPIKDYSYYCFTCKHSVCNECGAFDHKEHLLIQRKSCLNYDNSFFNDISKVIEDGIGLDRKKNKIKKDISKSISQLKEQLDIIEKNKLKEIDTFFDELKRNYINLKKNFLKTKECIENYYKINQKFFNLNINTNNEQGNTENNEVELANSIKKKKSGLTNFNTIDRYNYLKNNDISDNKDLDNTIFLMNFELMNLCDNKNLQILDLSNQINTKIKNISNLISQTTNNMLQEFKTNYLNFKENGIVLKFDDFYWDIKIRCEKFNENINRFKETIFDIYKRNHSFDKLKDLLSFFDSKNKKGKDVLFNQQYFIKSNDLTSLNNNMAKLMQQKLNKSLGKIRSNSKNKFNGHYSNTASTFKTRDNANSKDKVLLRNNQNGIDKYTKYGYKTMNSDSKIDLKTINTNINLDAFNTLNSENLNQITKKDDVILNQRVLTRFFAYFVMDFYSKYFKLIKPSEDENNNNNKDNNNYPEDSENIYYNKSNLAKNKQSLTSSATKKKSNLLKTSLNNPKLVKKNSRSASLLSNYTERYMNLKEKAKPLIGTNYIQFYDPATTKITRTQIQLQKDKHGYNVFPDGCRHILIENKLYITGGADNCGYPINIVLMFDIVNGQLEKIGNLNDNHAYHSIEYLDNFDSLIVIGGENSNSCEIMDLDSKRWNRLPALNHPRANANIYYNNVTSDLFVLFGMEGKMDKNIKNTDVIEVLELNDIISGWMMVDYYKSIGLDLKISYCLTLPFTRDKLLIYGGSTARSLERRIFALFDMIKNEVIKVDPKTMDLIKLEENKIRSFDKALERIM